MWSLVLKKMSSFCECGDFEHSGLLCSYTTQEDIANASLCL